MSHNTWLHKISRIIIVRPLLVTNVTPNQLTTLRLISGIAASYLVAIGEPSMQDIGAFFFTLSIILDRADGDLARLSRRSSPFGHVYDLVSDAVCNALIFVGLGIGLRTSDLGEKAILMGFIAGLAVAIILFFVIRLEKEKGARGGEIRNIGPIDVDDAIILVPILIWAEFSESLLLIASVATPIFSAYFLCKYISVIIRKTDK